MCFFTQIHVCVIKTFRIEILRIVRPKLKFSVRISIYLNRNLSETF